MTRAEATPPMKPQGKKRKWKITVGGGYGSFPFWGTEEEAEAMRRHKANWEGAPARKELYGKT